MPVTVDATDQLLALTAGMFPEVVGVAALHTGGEIPALMGGELGPAASMAPQRLREFAAGRAGARQAMARLGLTPVAIPVQPGRAPEWPAAVCGSISHTRDLAVAVVALRSHIVSLGIDLEPATGLERELFTRILRAEERLLLAGRAEAGLEAKLIFSAKESAYKCLWPVIRRFVDFDELEIRIAGTGRFRVVSHSPGIPSGLAAGIRGCHRIADGRILTGAWIRPGEVPGL